MGNFKSGFVSIIGRTNVGKSTLINSLVGEKVAIMTNKTQTTRTAIRAIVNRTNSQIIFIPGGFSGGDEPDGSGKFITAFFRNLSVKERVHELLNNRDGLMCGICNGFQALVKLGLVPFGKIIDPSEDSPALTFNSIARHQSKIVATRVVSDNSPWLKGVRVGDVINVPISHGEGRFIANDEVLATLMKNGQIATQYVDLLGNASGDVQFNPNNSTMAIEGILSPDGRVIGKMGHSERWNNGLYKNVYGNYDMKLFESAAKYFK
jgi:phosphoribosylformylglycinamidine synthase